MTRPAEPAWAPGSFLARITVPERDALLGLASPAGYRPGGAF